MYSPLTKSDGQINHACWKNCFANVGVVNALVMNRLAVLFFQMMWSIGGEKEKTDTFFPAFLGTKKRWSTRSARQAIWFLIKTRLFSLSLEKFLLYSWLTKSSIFRSVCRSVHSCCSSFFLAERPKETDVWRDSSVIQATHTTKNSASIKSTKSNEGIALALDSDYCSLSA